jgi:hypothetical protein
METKSKWKKPAKKTDKTEKDPTLRNKFRKRMKGKTSEKILKHIRRQSAESKVSF